MAILGGNVPVHAGLPGDRDGLDDFAQGQDDGLCNHAGEEEHRLDPGGARRRIGLLVQLDALREKTVEPEMPVPEFADGFATGLLRDVHLLVAQNAAPNRGEDDTFCKGGHRCRVVAGCC